MIAEPRLVLLDEPTSGLDSIEQATVADLLLSWASTRDVTVLMVEHHMDLVRRIATVVYGLVAGSLQAEGDATSVLDSSGYRLVGTNGPRAELRESS
jgi:ABC-type branched-subunit amino acid transport system ATPase component